MDLTEARTRAETKLREIEDPGTPLRLDDERQPEDFEWAWCFSFDSVRYFETRQFIHSVSSGPIVVNKDGSDVWVANSAPPWQQWLNRYAEEHGYPPVPVPELTFHSFGSDPASPATS